MFTKQQKNNYAQTNTSLPHKNITHKDETVLANKT